MLITSPIKVQLSLKLWCVNFIFDLKWQATRCREVPRCLLSKFVFLAALDRVYPMPIENPLCGDSLKKDRCPAFSWSCLSWRQLVGLKPDGVHSKICNMENLEGSRNVLFHTFVTFETIRVISIWNILSLCRFWMLILSETIGRMVCSEICNKILRSTGDVL